MWGGRVWLGNETIQVPIEVLSFYVCYGLLQWCQTNEHDNCYVFKPIKSWGLGFSLCSYLHHCLTLNCNFTFSQDVHWDLQKTENHEGFWCHWLRYVFSVMFILQSLNEIQTTVMWIDKLGPYPWTVIMCRN